MGAEQEVPGDWYAEAFDALYPVIYAHRTVAAAEPESSFAVRVLGIGPADRVLDLCCGNGRHLVHLQRSTPFAAGLDYSRDLLRHAREDHGQPRLVRGDMRRLPFPPCFDAVTNFFTSFGYFQDDACNALAAREIARVLKPRGRFFLDYLNPAQVRSGLRPESERAQGGYTIREERWIDETARRVNKRTRVEHGGAEVSRTFESVRLYSLDEMLALLEAAGLEIEHVFGDYSGAGVDEARPRMIFAGRSRRGHA